MCTFYYYVLIILLSSITTISGKRTYSFEARISSAPLDYLDTASTDRLYFRLCVNALCSTFTSVIWNNQATVYTYNVITPTDFGTINKIQIVHTGDDRLCVDHVKVDGVEYDQSFIPYCWKAAGDACNTLTITSANDWSKSETNPCEYLSEFNGTYIPTPIPTEPTKSPTILTMSPTDFPAFPTMAPTNVPSIAPTKMPYRSPHQTDSNIDLLMIIIILSIALVAMILIICCVSFCYLYQRGIKKGMPASDGQVKMAEDDKNGEQVILNAKSNIASNIHMDDEKMILDREQEEGHNDTGYEKEKDINNNEERDDMDELYLNNNSDALPLVPASPVSNKSDNTPGVSEIGAMEMEKKVLKKVDSLDDLYEPTDDNTPGQRQNHEEIAMGDK